MLSPYQVPSFVAVCDRTDAAHAKIRQQRIVILERNFSLGVIALQLENQTESWRSNVCHGRTFQVFSGSSNTSRFVANSPRT